MRGGDPQVSFADLEFMQQGVQLEPTFKAIADFLDRHGDLVEFVRRDLERGLKNRLTGRPGLTAQQVLRSLILMRVKNWDYRELRERIADGYTCGTSRSSTASGCPNTTRSIEASTGSLPPRWRRSIN